MVILLLVVRRMAWQAGGEWLRTTSATCRWERITPRRLLKPIQEELIGYIMANVHPLPQVGFPVMGWRGVRVRIVVDWVEDDDNDMDVKG